MEWFGALRGDDSLVPLNHGSFGGVPDVVLQHRADLLSSTQARMELFQREQLEALVEAAAARVATDLLGVPAEDVVLVDNATSAMNCAIRALHLGQDDVVVTSSVAYESVRILLDASPARVVSVPIDVAELMHAEAEDGVDVGALIAERFEAALDGLERVRAVVVDHIASKAALVLPVRKLAALGRKKGAVVVVDGAHAAGQVDLLADGGVAELADMYCTNLHKWAFVPHSCAALYVRNELQDSMSPPLVGHAHGQGFRAAFLDQGTRDVSAWLCVPRAMQFVEEDLGGWNKVRVRCRALLDSGVAMLHEEWGTASATPACARAFMALVEMPIEDAEGNQSTTGPASSELSKKVFRALLVEHGVASKVCSLGRRLWLRLSVAVYNSEEDVRRLAKAVLEVAECL